MTEILAPFIEAAELAVTSGADSDRDTLTRMIEDLDLAEASHEAPVGYLAVLLDWLDLREKALRLLRSINEQRNSEDAELLNLEGMLSAKSGDYAHAIEVLARALEAVTADDLLRTKILVNLAASCLRGGRASQSADYLVDAVKARARASNSAVDTLLATTQAGLARLSGNFEQFQTALASLEESSRRRLSELDNDSSQALEILANLAALEFESATEAGDLGLRHKSVEVLDVASRRLAAQLGESHPQVLISAANLRASEIVLACAENSEQRLGTAIDGLEIVSRRLDAVLGRNHPKSLAAAANVKTGKLILTQVRARKPDPQTPHVARQHSRNVPAPAYRTAGRKQKDRTATRRMCAGVYVDHEFRDQLLRGVYNDVSRRTAPSYGFDIVVVLQHAWRAWWISLAEHLALAGFLVVELARVPLQTVIAVAVLAAWSLAGSLRAWAEVAMEYAAGTEVKLDRRQIIAQGSLLGSGLAVAAGAAAVAIITSTARMPIGPATGGWVTRTGLVGAAIILVTCGAIVASAVAVRMACLAWLSRREPQRSPKPGRRLQVIGAQQNHPFTVHSGFRPFIGSGINDRSWSFAQRLVHRKVLDTEPDQEFDQPPFTTADLIGHLQETMAGIRDTDDPGSRLPGLKVANRVFVEGTHAPKFGHVLQSGPESATVQTAISEAADNPGDLARHYLECQAESWGGEVVTSVFAHVSLQGRTLYFECATYVLLPTRADYRLIDQTGGTGPRAFAKKIAAALVTLPRQMLAARSLARAPAQLWAAIRPRKDLTTRSGARQRKDTGAKMSIREAAAIVPEESYFQYQDSVQHSKIIERRLITAVGDYLRELDIDTSEFWERVAAVLNTGVINTAGTVNISDSAIGHQAAVKNPPSGPPQGSANGTQP